MLFLPVLAFAQSAEATGNASGPDHPRFYRIQVGTYREIIAAERTSNILRGAGLSPVYEYHAGYIRVVLPGIAAPRISFFLDMVNGAGLLDISVVDEANARHQITVGAFREAYDVERALNTLRDADLNPVYENHAYYRHVVLAGIDIRRLWAVLNTVHNVGFTETWLREEPEPAQLAIIIRGNAVVTEIEDTDCADPLAIVQTIPSFELAVPVEERTYHASAPLIFFFNDRIYLHSIAENIRVTADGVPIDGTIVINEGDGGFAVLSFTPNEPFPTGGEIVVVIGRGMQNAGGNEMLEDIGLAFIAEQGADTYFVGNYGFEQGDIGVTFMGDGAIMSARGPLVPFEGNYFAAISTGSRIVSRYYIAMGLTTSQIVLGPIPEPFFSISFYYNFISAEFNEYVGSEFDDTAMISINGPGGAHEERITSVNMIGFDNMPFIGFPGMPDDGDPYVGYTGWLNFRIDNIDVGSPAYIIFTVTDVGDEFFSSILAIDAIELGR